MALKCYSIDWKYLHWQVKYTPDQAQKISNKLARHFKIRLSGIRFANYSRGLAYYSGYIKFPKKDISLGMVCHEIGIYYLINMDIEGIIREPINI